MDPTQSLLTTPDRHSDRPSNSKSAQCKLLTARHMSNPDAVTAPIDPPRRRSSLAFSQMFHNMSNTPAKETSPIENSGNPAPDQIRPLSNVGRKRTATASATLQRIKSTPGHVAQMQKIFQDAKASLQVDMAFATSPDGSIAARLPPIENDRSHRDQVRTQSRDHQISDAQHDWRFSSAPRAVAVANADVREPFPDLAGLPPLQTFSKDQPLPPAEPLSSGFNSPMNGVYQDDVEHEMDGSILPPLPRSRPGSVHSVSLASSPVKNVSSDDGLVLPPYATTELEHPMTDLHVKRTTAWIEQTMICSDGSDKSEQEIFLSTPARDAAEAAWEKRGMVPSKTRSAEKHNTKPKRKAWEAALHALQYGSPTPSMLKAPAIQVTPSPGLPQPQHPRASGRYLQPPGATRVNSKGSPMPHFKQKIAPMSPILPMSAPAYPQDYAYGKRLSLPLEAIYNDEYGDPEHFQPDWSQHVPASFPAPPQTVQPSPATENTHAVTPKHYAFSTANAFKTGTIAPAAQIRDAYRTDTLTPLAHAAPRYRKHGLAAMTIGRSKGVGKYYPVGAYHNGTMDRDSFRLGPRSGAKLHRGYAGLGSQRVPRDPEEVKFRSSPPRALAAPPRRRRKRNSGQGFAIREDDTATTHPIAEEEGPGLDHKQPRTSPIRGHSEEVRELSPNVTPFRKGKGPKFARRAKDTEFWDRDILEMQRDENPRVLPFHDSRFRYSLDATTSASISVYHDAIPTPKTDHDNSIQPAAMTDAVFDAEERLARVASDARKSRFAENLDMSSIVETQNQREEDVKMIEG